MRKDSAATPKEEVEVVVVAEVVVAETPCLFCPALSWSVSCKRGRRVEEEGVRGVKGVRGGRGGRGGRKGGRKRGVWCPLLMVVSLSLRAAPLR